MVGGQPQPVQPPSLIVTASTPEMESPNHLLDSSSHSPNSATTTTTQHPISRTRATSLSRPPSLNQLTEAMRLNPDRWQQLKIETETVHSNSNSNSTTTSSPTPPSSTGSSRLRLQLATLQRSNSSSQHLNNPTLPHHQHSIHPTVPKQPTSLEPTSGTLQRRASASDLNTGLNRTRLPSLAAIQERMSRTRHENSLNAATCIENSETTINHTTEHSNKLIINDTPGPTTTTTTTTTQAPILSSISPSQRADLLQADALTQPIGPSLGTPNLSSIQSLGSSLNLVQTPLTTSLPLQHHWTLYFDSKATLATARRTTSSGTDGSPEPHKPINGSSPPPTTTHSHLGSGVEAYQASLKTIGSFKTVESFCRYFNWTIRPSQMEMNSSVQLFKDGIKPMWEDPANSNGGKWTITFKQQQTNLNLLDKIWTYLVLGLVGETIDINENDLISGTIISIKPRGNRIQIWLKDSFKDLNKINEIGFRLINLLELNDQLGISFEFSLHNKVVNQEYLSFKFISIQPSNHNNMTPQRPGISSSIGSYTVGVPNLQQNRRPIISNEMRRTTSLDQSTTRPPMMLRHSGINQLVSSDPPIQNGIWRPSVPPPPPPPHPNLIRTTSLGHLPPQHHSLNHHIGKSGLSFSHSTSPSRVSQFNSNSVTATP